MNTIEKIYTNYDGLLEEFSEEVIQSRYAVFYEEIEEFAKSLGIREKIQISESLLSHAVLDYFTDISRLKHFHQAKHINSLKVISYETYWLLRRKPIQILVEDETSDAMAFLNEKFVFSRIAKYLMGDGKRVILSPETKKGFLNYLDSLFYYLKYRNYDAEMLEMMLMGFKAGVLVADELKEQESRKTGGSGIQQDKMKIERTGRVVRLLSGSFFVRCCIKCRENIAMHGQKTV